MSGMFGGSSFNGDISGWDVSSVTIMTYMFRNSTFNGDLSGWDVSSVTDMSGHVRWLVLQRRPLRVGRLIGN